jgi:myo-inositol-1(or 4)-monophosphatase
MLNIAEIAAQAAADVATDFIQDAGIVSNRDKDIKTLADEKMNEVIYSHLLPSGIPIISEESDSNGALIPKKCWIIDPLDGTFNFTRAYPFYGVSVSLWEIDGPVIGVVKDISNSISYSSEKGNGSKMNGKPIHVSTTEKLSNAILTTGFPSGGDYSTEYLLGFVSSVQKFKKVRAIGSASLMLCHVAQGICDVYYENDIYLWDVAAGILLVEEAGGKVYLRRKGNSWKYEVLASNASVHEEASELLIK